MAVTPEMIHNEIRNEHHQTFKLGDREFPIKSLAYDDYLEFVDLARPIIEAVANSLEVTGSGQGETGAALNPAGLDAKQLIKLAGNELPRMAWICCRQSDPKISIAEVKRLAGRPFVLIEVVLMQVKHNQIVKEFADFFPRLGKIVGELIPEMTTAVQTTSVSETTL